MNGGVFVLNELVNGQANFDKAAPVFLHEEDHQAHMLLVAMDYSHTNRPLTCSIDARNMEELGEQSCVRTLSAIYNEQCTKEAVLQAIRTVGSKCRPDDFFVIYFAGHGANMSDAASEGGDETKGPHDEALMCVNNMGGVSPQTLLSSSELCAEVLGTVPPETRTLFLADCCHYASVVDLSGPQWEGRQAIAISGCQDLQCHSDNIWGGLLTHSLLLAVEKLSRVGRDHYSVGMLFNAALLEDEAVFGGRQDLYIQTAPGMGTDSIAWPFVPPPGYQAPFSRCATPFCFDHQAAAPLISPDLVNITALDALNVPVSIEEYISQVQGGAGLMTSKPCRACRAGCSTGQCSVQ